MKICGASVGVHGGAPFPKKSPHKNLSPPSRRLPAGSRRYFPEGPHWSETCGAQPSFSTAWSSPAGAALTGLTLRGPRLSFSLNDPALPEAKLACDSHAGSQRNARRAKLTRPCDQGLGERCGVGRRRSTEHDAVNTHPSGAAVRSVPKGQWNLAPVSRTAFPWQRLRPSCPSILRISARSVCSFSR